jgi:tetratricopeptide (TPR) repeat protein
MRQWGKRISAKVQGGRSGLRAHRPMFRIGGFDMLCTAAARWSKEACMRRATFVVLLSGVLAAGVVAQTQIGKRVSVQAGSAEDRALLAINNETDSAKKVELANKYLEEYGKGDLAIPAYELLLDHFAAQKDYERVFEYGDKILRVDPDNFSATSSMTRAAQEKGDVAKLISCGEIAGKILQRFKAAPPPEGTAADAWQKQKDSTLTAMNDQIQYLEYSLFNTGYQIKDAAQRAGFLERFLAAFPDSQYAGPAQQLVAASYQQAQNVTKMLEFASGVLARDPDNVAMLLLVADSLSEKGEQLEKAEAGAKRAYELLGKTPKPAQLTDEQWASQKALQQGLAQSALGQVYLHQKKFPQAVDALKTASPLLKADANSYGRNLYRLGFAHIQMKNTAEARKALTEAVSVESPYKPYAQDLLTKLSAPAKKRR